MNSHETPPDPDAARAMHKQRASMLYERVATAMDGLGVLRGTLLAIASTRMAPTDVQEGTDSHESAFATWTALEAAVAGLESVADRVREQGDALAMAYRDVSGTGVAATPRDTSRDDLARLIQRQRASLMALNQQIVAAESNLRAASSDFAHRPEPAAPRSEESVRFGAVELQDVNEFLQESPIASVPVNATYFQRILEAARSKEGHKRPMGSILREAGLITRRHMARRHCCFPMEVFEGSITVAMANPLDLIALEDLRLVTGKHVRPGVASRDEISRHIDRHYAGSSF